MGPVAQALELLVLILLLRAFRRCNGNEVFGIGHAIIQMILDHPGYLEGRDLIGSLPLIGSKLLKNLRTKSASY